MGFDVYGRNPTSERGRYFRNSIWGWHPLAGYCNAVAPAICAPCKYWHSNDGEGLDAFGAVALAHVLEAEIESGRTESYARASRPGDKPHKDVESLLGVLGSLGFTDVAPSPPDPSSFVENVAGFVAFLRDSGGFEIW